MAFTLHLRINISYAARVPFVLTRTFNNYTYYIVLTRHAWSPSDDTAALAAITAPCLMRARQGLSKRGASHADPYGIQPDGFALVTVRRGSGAPAC